MSPSGFCLLGVILVLFRWLLPRLLRGFCWFAIGWLCSLVVPGLLWVWFEVVVVVALMYVDWRWWVSIV